MGLSLASGPTKSGDDYPEFQTSQSVFDPNLVPYTPPAPANFRCWKHSLQNTGRPCVGRNGTVVSLPHAEHCVCVSTRSRAGAGPALTRLARLALHVLHRFGSFLNCLSAKNSCSPAVQINSEPQSTHLKDLSWNSIGRHLVLVDRGTACPYSVSRRSFLRFRLRANACLARRLSPGFK
jgi:hypothetical protein